MVTRVVSAGVAAVLMVATVVVAPRAATAAVARERVLVQVRDGDPDRAAADLASRHQGRITHVYRRALNGFAMDLPAPAVAALRSDPRVVTVERDQPVRAFEVPTGVARAAITADAVADIDGRDERVDVDIAIVDSGIDSTHPDLNVVGGVDCSTSTCVPVAPPVDPNGHGTHVAGTAAAIDDGNGVVGAAPGARLWSVRVLDANGESTLSAVLAALDWLVANAGTIEVANASLGCACTSATLDAAVSRVADAGVVLTTAAGNAAEDITGHALTAHPDVITVSALADLDGSPGGGDAGSCDGQADDTFASFSSHGEAVDLAAPGVCILSTFPGGYARVSGTSMAAPHVAGVAALHVVQHGVARSADRAAIVRQGLVADRSVPQTSDCGFAGGVSGEPLLYLTRCAGDAANTAPSVTISTPADGTRVTTGEAVTFSGSASDSQDGDLTASIAWTSDIDGNLGAGGRVSAVLGEGSHLVTARVIDAAGAAATSAVTVHVDAATEDAPSPGDAPASQPTIGRLAGADRIATSVQVSRAVFAEGAPAAVVAYAGNFPDALAATPLAAAVGGPVLLNQADGLSPDVAGELDRLSVTTVYVLGGTAAQSTQVEQDLHDRGLRPVRVSGPDRFATAARAATSAVDAWRSAGVVPSSNAVLALGTDFPDALSGGALAATRRAPLLLTAADQLPASTGSALRELGVTSVTVLGGTAAVSETVLAQLRGAGFTVDRVFGATRFETAVAAAEAAVRSGAGYGSVLLASGRSFPDALTGAPAVVARGGVLLLSERDHLPGATDDAMRTARTIGWVRLAGGPGVLTDAVLDQAASASGIDP